MANNLPTNNDEEEQERAWARDLEKGRLRERIDMLTEMRKNQTKTDEEPDYLPGSFDWYDEYYDDLENDDDLL